MAEKSGGGAMMLFFQLHDSKAAGDFAWLVGKLELLCRGCRLGGRVRVTPSGVVAHLSGAMVRCEQLRDALLDFDEFGDMFRKTEFKIGACDARSLHQGLSIRGVSEASAASPLVRLPGRPVGLPTSAPSRPSCVLLPSARSAEDMASPLRPPKVPEARSTIKDHEGRSARPLTMTALRAKQAAALSMTATQLAPEAATARQAEVLQAPAGRLLELMERVEAFAAAETYDKWGATAAMAETFDWLSSQEVCEEVVSHEPFLAATQTLFRRSLSSSDVETAARCVAVVATLLGVDAWLAGHVRQAMPGDMALKFLQAYGGSRCISESSVVAAGRFEALHIFSRLAAQCEARGELESSASAWLEALSSTSSSAVAAGELELVRECCVAVHSAADCLDLREASSAQHLEQLLRSVTEAARLSPTTQSLPF